MVLGVFDEEMPSEEESRHIILPSPEKSGGGNFGGAANYRYYYPGAGGDDYFEYFNPGADGDYSKQSSIESLLKIILKENREMKEEIVLLKSEVTRCNARDNNGVNHFGPRDDKYSKNKLRQCKYFIRGKCRFGSTCKYLHKRESCKYFAENRCYFGTRCFNIHSEILPKEPEMYIGEAINLEELHKTKAVNTEVKVEDEATLVEELPEAVEEAAAGTDDEEMDTEETGLEEEAMARENIKKERAQKLEMNLDDGVDYECEDFEKLNKEVFEETVNESFEAEIYKGRREECGLCKKSATLKCSRCNWVYYCSKTHQQNHWNMHKPFCKYLSPYGWKPVSSKKKAVKGRCKKLTSA